MFTPYTSWCRGAWQTGCEIFKLPIRVANTVLVFQFLKDARSIPSPCEEILEGSSLGSSVGNTFQDQMCSYICTLSSD